ncbi:MAG: hypothetical protein K8S94_07480 [Planctomycetia bacterium]|nr:hypothetical protein [Planctomycetia bacterium]
MMPLASLFRSRQAADEVPRVAIMGGLRTGTNYLKFLLESNYVVRGEFNGFGWKHGGVPILPAGGPCAYPDIPLCYIVKNPFAFVRSLHSYHCRKRDQGHAISLVAAEPWDEFLTSPIVIFDSQLAGSPQLRFANPVHYWNFLYWNLETLDRQRFRVWGVNYEDLVADPQRLREIEGVAPLVRRHAEIVTPGNKLKRLGGGADVAAASGYETAERFDADAYMSAAYLDAFSEAQRAFIRAETDPWLIDRRGYADVLRG